MSGASGSIALVDVIGADLSDGVREFLAEACAENTTRSYRSALRYWASWYEARFNQAFRLPIGEAVVTQFVLDHVVRSRAGQIACDLPGAVDAALVLAGVKAKPGPLKLSTVLHRVAVLSTAHRLKKLPSPCELPAVRLVLASARRATVKRGERPRKKKAIEAQELRSMLSTCDSSLIGIRDRAVLCFGFSSGGRRRSEIASADMRDLRRLTNGDLRISAIVTARFGRS